MELRGIRRASGRAQTQFSTLLPGLEEPTFWQRHRALRWALPLLALGLLAAGSVQLTSSDDGADALPATTPDAVMKAVRTPAREPYSGTVVSRLSSDVPQVAPVNGVDDLSGSHTLRVWYGGPQRERIALLTATTETDVFRDGTDVWHWNTADHHAVHSVLSAHPAPAAPVPTSGDPLGLTPAALAASALSSVDAATTVVLAAQRTVADRRAYDLVITPDRPTTKIGSVRIAIDGVRMVPLAVQVFARGQDTPAVDVAFTGITFRRPDATNFRFAPPSEVSVREGTDTSDHVTGTGWTSVVGYPDAAVPLSGVSAAMSFVSVSGSWGSGQLFECALVSMLVRRDGTVFVGTVDPAALYTAATAK